MEIEKRIKPSFSVIGKEGSTLDGQGFIQKLWSEATARFSEVLPLAGAVHDFACPANGKSYMLFPVRRL
ncbi:MAG: hypothetical protein IJD60_05745 [Clostridia bacterium]|nr:hypothetical protein [Clostridia bacterium]